MPLPILKCKVTTLKQVKVASTAKQNDIEFKFNGQMESQKQSFKVVSKRALCQKKKKTFSEGEN